MSYRRRTFIIDRAFQLRFSFYICSWLFALSLIYPFVIHQLFDFFLRYVRLKDSSVSVQVFEQIRTEVFWLLVGLQAVFLGVTFLLAVFLSHRIAGPLHKLKGFFELASEGRLRDRLSFRKADYFADVAEGFNAMMAAVQRRDARAVETLSTAIARVEALRTAQADPAVQAQLQGVLTDLRGLRDSVS